jgi:inhibitor of cysteine peptidase
MTPASTYAISVPVRHIFTLTLDANPTTAYQWVLSNPLDPRYLRFVSSEYAPPSLPSRIGQSGHQIWTFRAIQAGMTSIALKYCRPWDAAGILCSIS